MSATSAAKRGHVEAPGVGRAGQARKEALVHEAKHPRGLHRARRGELLDREARFLEHDADHNLALRHQELPAARASKGRSRFIVS